MSIIVMLDTNAATFPEGAYCPLGNSNGYNKRDEIKLYSKTDGSTFWGGVLVLAEEYAGCCLREREANSYHDSDFYMTVWDETAGQPKEICFASTRGWTYPCLNSKVDATPEVLAKYETWKAAAARRERIQSKWNARRSDRFMAQALGFESGAQFRRLREALGGRPVRVDFAKGHMSLVASKVFDGPQQRTFLAVVKLLKTEKFKSEFKASLAAQVRSWARDPAPRHPTPLSQKQLGYV